LPQPPSARVDGRRATDIVGGMVAVPSEVRASFGYLLQRTAV
jgi:hypothetical protein